jgi:hypothetical protein
MKVERQRSALFVLATSAAVEVAAGHAEVSVPDVVGDVLELGAALAGQGDVGGAQAVGAWQRMWTSALAQLTANLLRTR